MVLFLDDADVDRLVTMDDALVSVRAALAAQGQGLANNAPRQKVTLSGAMLNIMGGAFEPAPLNGAIGEPGGWMGAKISVAAGGRKRAWMMLFDQQGVLRCLLGANRLGQLRTGAATGVSTDVLARPDARVLACLGAGYQAWTQVEAVARVRTIERVLVWSRTPERARDFAGRLRAKLGVVVETCETPGEAVRLADVVVTITSSPTPILSGADVREGAHVILAGSNHPQRREADANVFARARAVYADDLHQARAVSGDLRLAVEEKAISWDDVKMLGSAVAPGPQPLPIGDPPGELAHGTTVFCSQGVGSWDVALAREVWKRAVDRHVGTDLGVDGTPLSNPFCSS